MSIQSVCWMVCVLVTLVTHGHETSSDPVTTLTVQLKTHSLNIERKFTDIDDKLPQIGTFNNDVKMTDMDGKLTDMDRKLTDMDENLTDMDGKLTDMDRKLTDMDENLTDMDGKLTELVSNKITVGQEQVSLRIQNVAMGTKLDKILEELSKLRREDNTVQIICAKGAHHTSPREKIKLWGRVPALCDKESDGGGWVIIQRRTKHDVDFYKGWDDYKKGFGTPDTDYWLGNDNIHNLTSQGYTDLRVDIEYDGRQYFAEYSNCSVADEISKYKLTFSGYNGNATDMLTQISGMYFTTYDRDNDQHDYANCAAADQLHGAWWYHSCSYTNLNGWWGAKDYSASTWYYITGTDSVTWSEMKIRHV